MPSTPAVTSAPATHALYAHLDAQLSRAEVVPGPRFGVAAAAHAAVVELTQAIAAVAGAHGGHPSCWAAAVPDQLTGMAHLDEVGQHLVGAACARLGSSAATHAGPCPDQAEPVLVDRDPATVAPLVRELDEQGWSAQEITRSGAHALAWVLYLRYRDEAALLRHVQDAAAAVRPPAAG